MEQARFAFENGLTKEQIQAFYGKSFSSDKMEQARIAFEHGLTIEQVETFYKPEIECLQMAQARLALEQSSAENSTQTASSSASKPRTSSMNFFN